MNVGAVMATRVVSVKPEESVQVAIARMMESHVGSVAVCRGNELVGIFTERDVLRLASQGTSFAEVAVGDVMTKRPVTASPDVLIDDAAHMMGEKRIRHLPVVEGDNLVGMVGIRDILRTLLERAYAQHDESAKDTAGTLLQRG
jgi:CBS domain-containing protein